MADWESPLTGEFFNSMFLSNNTKAVFYQAAAPVYWSIVGSVGDRFVGVSDMSSGGYNDYDAGTLQGTRTSPTHVHQTYSHILTLGQLPWHTHSVTRDDGGDGTYDVFWITGKQYGSLSTTPDTYTEYSGSDQPHTHGDSQPAASYDMSLSWFPDVAVCIIANKDG